MENLKEFIKPELLTLVPVLYFIGMGLKKMDSTTDKYIPALLGAAGIVLATLYVLATGVLSNWQTVVLAVFTGITQGILCAGATVYINQLIKQAGKEDKK